MVHDSNAEKIAFTAIEEHHAIQHYNEFASFLRLVDRKRPRLVLEIGLGFGGSLYALSQLLPESKLVSVTKFSRLDVFATFLLRCFGKRVIPFLIALKFFLRPWHTFRGVFHLSEKKKETLCFIASELGFLRLLHEFVSTPLNERVFFVFGDSTSRETIGRCRVALKGQKADLLFIDGSHSYEDVKSDWENYYPFVAKGGIIAFHDISSERFGVKRFWLELRHKLGGKRKLVEIVSPDSEMGIGLVFK